MSGIEARLERLEAERGVLDTLHRYGQGVTFQDRELWLSAFGDDATLTMRYFPGSEFAVDLQGRAAIADWFDGHLREWPAGSEAQLTINPRVSITGDTASSTCTFIVLMCSTEGVPSVRTIGRYDDALARDAGGVWRITARAVVTTTRRTYGAGA